VPIRAGRSAHPALSGFGRMMAGRMLGIQKIILPSIILPNGSIPLGSISSNLHFKAQSYSESQLAFRCFQFLMKK